jgi:hypothetical protein
LLGELIGLAGQNSPNRPSRPIRILASMTAAVKPEGQHKKRRLAGAAKRLLRFKKAGNLQGGNPPHLAATQLPRLP